MRSFGLSLLAQTDDPAVCLMQLPALKLFARWRIATPPPVRWKSTGDFIYIKICTRVSVFNHFFFIEVCYSKKRQICSCTAFGLRESNHSTTGPTSYSWWGLFYVDKKILSVIYLFDNSCALMPRLQSSLT
jgi:hypothetical protein